MKNTPFVFTPVFILLLCTFSCKKDPVTTPQNNPAVINYEVELYKTYEGSSIIDAIQIDESTTYILRKAAVENSSDWQLEVVKIDENKEIAWTKSYGTPERELPIQLLETTDGNIIILAKRIWVEDHTLVIKINQDGDVIWQKIHHARPDHIINTNDGGYAITDLNGYFDPDSEYELILAVVDARILKLDANGDKEWVNSCGELDLIKGLTTIFQDENNEYTLIGASFAPGTSNYGITMLKTTEFGALKMMKTIPVDKHEYPLYAIEAVDDGFIVLGQFIFYPDRKFLLIKLDEDGNMVWKREKDRKYFGSSIVAGADSYFLNAAYDGEMYIMNVGLNGEIKEVAFDESIPTAGRKIFHLSDGRLVVVGSFNDTMFYLELKEQ